MNLFQEKKGFGILVWMLFIAIAIIGLVLIYAAIRALLYENGPDVPDFNKSELNPSNLKGVYKMVSGQKFFITNDQLYLVKADGSLERLAIYFDDNYFADNYVQESGILYRKDLNTGAKYATRTQMSEGFENADKIGDLINPERGWTDLTLQSPLAKTPADYVPLGQAIVKGTADFKDNVVDISGDRAHSGSKSLKAYSVSPSSGMVTAKARLGTELLNFVSGDNVWYEAWYYLDEGRPIAIMELESTWIQQYPGIRIRMDENDNLMVEFKDYEKPNYKQEAGKEIAFPRKQWVKVKLHLKLDFENGLIELWQDDKKIISTNAQTLSLPGEIYNTVGFGVTANYAGQDTTLYVDDVKISNSAF
jgi:hypothetical protein